MRHTCASLLFAANVPLDAVSDQLGHASIHVTKDVYVHLLPGAGEKTARAMEDLLYGDHVQVIPPALKAGGEELARPLASADPRRVPTGLA